MTKVLMVLSEVGYTWDEVILPWDEFRKAGVAVDFATPTGGPPKLDPLSIVVRPVRNLIGFGTAAKIAPETALGLELQRALETILPLEGLNPQNYSAIFLAGGHGSLFDLNLNKTLHALILAFHRQGKGVGALCHAASTLAFVQEDGHSLVRDRLVTGFPTFQELFILRFGMIHPNFLPMPIWTGRELDKHSQKRGLGIRIAEFFNMGLAVRDGNISTGLGPKSGRNLARKMLEVVA